MPSPALLRQPCAVDDCPSARQTTVTVRVGGTFQVVPVCRRHAGAFVAAREPSPG